MSETPNVEPIGDNHKPHIAKAVKANGKDHPASDDAGKIDDELGDNELSGFDVNATSNVLDDAEELRLDPDEDIQEAVKAPGPVPVRMMPGKQVFFRVMPGNDWRWATAMYNDEELGAFIVTKKMRPYVEEVRPYVILTCITSKGVEFFWPVPVPREDENALTREWGASKRRCAAVAETKWIKMKSNKEAGYWDHFISKGNLDEPRWSGRTFKEMFDSAFADKIIRDVSHPVIKCQQGM
jgi:hypothetical protein